MNPDEELALLIAERLVNQGFVDPEKREEVSAMIANGTATTEDWRLWIELGPHGQKTSVGHAED